MLNFGSYHGDQILGQALNNIAARKHQEAQFSKAQEQEAKYKDAYLQIAKQNASIAQKNLAFQDWQRNQVMREYNTKKAVSDWTAQWAGNLRQKDSPILFEDGLFSDGAKANPNDKTFYITPKDQDNMWQSFSDHVKRVGGTPNYAEFQQQFHSLLGMQAENLKNSLAAFRSEHKISADKMNKALMKTEAGGLLQQALIAGYDSPTQIGYMPNYADMSSRRAGGVGRNALGLYTGYRVGKHAVQGYKAAKAATGALDAGKAFMGEYGTSTFKALKSSSKWAKFSKLAMSEEGRGHLMRLVEKKMGPAFAKKFGIKMAGKLGAGMAANIVPGIGQAVDAGMTAWALYDLYSLVKDILD